jgi:hypothetical protein
MPQNRGKRNDRSGKVQNPKKNQKQKVKNLADHVQAIIPGQDNQDDSSYNVRPIRLPKARPLSRKTSVVAGVEEAQGPPTPDNRKPGATNKSDVGIPEPTDAPGFDTKPTKMIQVGKVAKFSTQFTTNGIAIMSLRELANPVYPSKKIKILGDLIKIGRPASARRSLPISKGSSGALQVVFFKTSNENHCPGINSGSIAAFFDNAFYAPDKVYRGYPCE